MRTVFGVRRMTLVALIHVLVALARGKNVLVVCLTATRLTFYALRLLALVMKGRFYWRCEGSHPWYSSPTFFTDADGNNIRHAADAMIMRITGNAVDHAASSSHSDQAFKRFTGYEDVFRLYYEIELFTEIREHVFVSFSLYSGKLRLELEGGDDLVLLVPSTWWCDFLKKEVESHGVGVRRVWHLNGLRYLVAVMLGFSYGLRSREGQWQRCLRKLSASFRSLQKLWRGEAPVIIPWTSPVELYQLPYGKHGQTETSPLRPEGPRVSTVLYDGIAPTQRSNVKWFWEQETTRSALHVMACGDTVSLDGATRRLLHESGARVLFDRPRDRDGAEVEAWLPPAHLMVRFVGEEMEQLRSIVLSSLLPWAGQLRWQIHRLLDLMYSKAWWQTFFQENDVKVFVEDYYNRDAVARYWAMRSLGGVTLTTERSQEFDQGHILSERYADIHLMAGEYGVKQSLRPGLRERVLLTGFPLDSSPLRCLSGRLGEIKNTLSGDKPLVMMVDEGGLRFGREHVFSFYEALLKDLENSDEYRLLVKSKKAIILNEAYARNKDLFDRLIDAGKLIALDFECAASVAATLCDICISLPSTAMFDPMVMGKPTAVYNPGRSVHTVFYEHGLEDIVVFDELETLISSFHDYLSGENPGFGDASSFVSEIDRFGDGKASERMGYAIEHLRCSFAEGASREVAMSTLMQDYENKWGNEAAGRWDAYIDGPGTVECKMPFGTADDRGRS